MFCNYKKIRVAFFVAVLILLSIRFFNGLMLHQLQGNPVFYTSKDLTFIVFSSIPILKTVFQSSFTAWLVDVLLFIGVFGALFTPKSNKFPLLFSVSLFFYIIIYYSSHGVHHSLVALFFMSIPFVFKQEKFFNTALSWVRLSVVWVYFSAGLWKILRGAFLHSGYFSTLIKEHYGLQMFYQSNSFTNNIRWFVADNTALSNGLFMLLICIELLFFIAFFTQKYDVYFVVFAVLFQTATWFFADTYFFDFAPAFIPFLIKNKEEDLTVKRFLNFNKENNTALSLFSFHVVVFVYALFLIALSKYNAKVFTVFPFQNYYMYSDPYTKNTFGFIEILEGEKCINCIVQFPPQREVINANIKNCTENNSELKNWIANQIVQKYKCMPTNIDIVYLKLPNKAEIEMVSRKTLLNVNNV